MRPEKRPADRTSSTKNARKQHSISSARRRVAAAFGLAILIAGFAAWYFWQRPPKVAGSGAFYSSQSSQEAEAKVFATYAGSISCRECHQLEYDLWARSNHGLAERPLRAEVDGAAFNPARSFKHGSQTTQVRNQNGEFQIVSLGSSSNLEPQRVERVIGNDPLRQFLAATGDGRWQAHEASYDPKSNQWFDVFGDDNRQPGMWGHWTGRGMNWNSRCAECHNTRLRKNYDENTDAYHTTMAEMSVGCEACHGPRKAHVDWRRTHPNTKSQDPTTTQTASRSISICGSCHSRRDNLTGDFKPGDSYFDHYALEIPNEGDHWYADGQVKEEDYEFASFLGSRMHQSGVGCQDCHNPHSMKLIAPGNDLCLRCHQGNVRPFTNAPVINAIEHGHHPLTSKGSECVGCHMPTTVYMQRHPRHDHGFTIPDPLLTKQLEIPNACNRCHKDQSPDWALGYVEKWYGAKMNRHTRERAQWIAAAQRGEEGAKDRLLGMLADHTESFYWKAVATGLLEPWADNSVVKAALVARLGDEHPLVREQAARALGALLEHAGNDSGTVASLQPLLKDPARNARMAAAWALRASIDLQDPAAKELQDALALDADQPTGQFRKARWLLDRQQPEQALARLQKAIHWDPASPPLRFEIATLLDQLGRPAEAENELRVACQLEPDSAEAHFKLALVLAETHRLDQAAQTLEQAVKLDPRHARAWYNLGLARSSLGDATEALEALTRAESLALTDPEIPYARATILARTGRYAEARTAASRALELRSDFQPAQELLQNLPVH